MDGRNNEWMDETMNGWMDETMNGWMGETMDGWKETIKCLLPALTPAVSCCAVQKDCNQQKAVLKHRFTPSLFQHVGLHSSLPEIGRAHV